uniref:Uncharacterized protein n=1 Tax=Avena sativa TaxID=4498 RepID=A0ACD5YHV8_AVESA
MSRRFVNLLVNKLSGRRPTFSLHRIDTAILFCPTGSPKPADPAAPARLPPAAVSFYPRNQIGWMDFTALNDDVIAVDHEGRTLLYDGAVGAVRAMNPIIGPSFKDWFWYPLTPLRLNELDLLEDPRYNKYKLGLEQLDPFEVGAYTTVAGDSSDPWISTLPDVWISTVGAGTYSLHNAEWSKLGDWALPFRGRAHYVAEHGLWFGFSEKDQQLCAADLKQQPPAPPLREFPLLHHWEEEEEERSLPLPESWTPTATSLFPLGSGKLCIARCFRATNGEKLLPSEYMHEKASKSFAVLSGVEFVEDAGKGSLQIIKHNSVCYGIGENVVKPL